MKMMKRQSFRLTTIRTLAVAAALGVRYFSVQVAGAGDQGAAIEAAIATITDGEVREHAGLLADDTLEGRAAGSRRFPHLVEADETPLDRTAAE